MRLSLPRLTRALGSIDDGLEYTSRNRRMGKQSWPIRVGDPAVDSDQDHIFLYSRNGGNTSSMIPTGLSSRFMRGSKTESEVFRT
jgi:hypothetical protein